MLTLLVPVLKVGQVKLSQLLWGVVVSHTPLEHVCPWLHVFPHEPQLFSSVFLFFFWVAQPDVHGSEKESGQASESRGTFSEM